MKNQQNRVGLVTRPGHVQGEEVKLRFAQHWSRGNEEILTYETVIGGKTLSAKGPDTDSAANAVALAALIKFYPPQLLDRQGLCFKFNWLNA